MPWKEAKVVDLRIQFVLAHQEDPGGNLRALCRQFGISAPTGYKWLRRFEEGGQAALESQSSGRREPPNRTPESVVARILELRKKHPFDGPKKLRARMLALAETAPAASTIGDILKKFGMIRPRKRRIRVAPYPSPLTAGSAPNDVWCIDFKGQFPLGDGTRCYPLTITDLHSRFILVCEALTHPIESEVRRVCERLFGEFGVPKVIRSDNGTPFASKAIGGLSKLSVWWHQLGIVHERIEPGEPQQNGVHERMHRTLKEQCCTPAKGTMIEQQLAFDRFRADFNEHRPHEALNLTPPAKHYALSTRTMPANPTAIAYPSHYLVRHVNDRRIQVAGRRLQVGTVLDGALVGLEAIDEAHWSLYLGPTLLGRLQLKGERLYFEMKAA